ncbi:hypothetical protein [Neorhodopirellula pilleata]|uniref:Uncharacterized protein n=1 Tax=Neorhodopirellula pilleata TaxID=2714738 RepID=A0A5C5ZWZ3_9BACT|nr:hypothetical protein [Neorhodopirellula pilleata]TWT91655.1 hypothetical protein Pla100_50730 [Neorhodopirellula pilleata]
MISANFNASSATPPPDGGPPIQPAAAPKTWNDLTEIEPRLINIASDAAAQRWSLARYEAMECRVRRFVGWHARDPRLGSSAAYEIAVSHLAGLMRDRSRRGRR